MAKLIQDISIGKNLKQLRKAQGLTQTDMCARMGVIGRPMSQSTYAMIESGTRNIFVSDLLAMKTILNAEFEELFANLEPINKYELDMKPR